MIPGDIVRVASDANDMEHRRGQVCEVVSYRKSSFGTTGYTVRFADGTELELDGTELEYAYGEGIRVGVRCELSPHMDLWAQGARYGTIKALRAEGNVSVKLDKLRKRIHTHASNLRVNVSARGPE